MRSLWARSAPPREIQDFSLHCTSAHGQHGRMYDVYICMPHPAYLPLNNCERGGAQNARRAYATFPGRARMQWLARFPVVESGGTLEFYPWDADARHVFDQVFFPRLFPSAAGSRSYQKYGPGLGPVQRQAARPVWVSQV